MLLRAVEQVRQGKRVIVVAASSRHFTYMRGILERHGVKLARNFPIRFVSCGSTDYLRGLSPDRDAVLVDHFVWESAGRHNDHALAALYETTRYRPGLVHE